MKFKLKGTIESLNYKKGSVKIVLKFAGLEMPNVVNILNLVNDSFDVTFAKKINDKPIKLKIKNVLYDSLNFGKDANSILKLDVEPNQIPLLEKLNDFDELVAMLIEGGNDDD